MIDKIDITEVKTTLTNCSPAIAVTLANIAKKVEGTPSSSLFNIFISLVGWNLTKVQRNRSSYFDINTHPSCKVIKAFLKEFYRSLRRGIK